MAYDCQFQPPCGATSAQLRQLGSAICRLRMEVKLRKRSRARKTLPRTNQSQRRVKHRRLRAPYCPQSVRELLDGRQPAPHVRLGIDLRMLSWPKDQIPQGDDLNSIVRRLGKLAKPPPPVERAEMIRIIQQFVSPNLVEDVLVDRRSWNEM